MLLRTVIAAAFLLLAASGAEASCAPFPQSKLLGSYTHAQVTSYVKSKHDGDWGSYIDQLVKFQARLNDLMTNANTRHLKVRGGTVDVQSREFSRFVYESRQWLQVAQCLAGIKAQETILALNEFATASGTNDQAEANKTEPLKDAAPQPTVDETVYASRKSEVLELGNEVASLNVSPVTVKVTTVCDAGDTIFSITNLGDTWPNMGVIAVYGGTSSQNPRKVSAQRTRLDKGERKTIKVKRKHNPYGEIGLAIEPSWYSRPLEMDAMANCL